VIPSYHNILATTMMDPYNVTAIIGYILLYSCSSLVAQTRDTMYTILRDKRGTHTLQSSVSTRVCYLAGTNSINYRWTSKDSLNHADGGVVGVTIQEAWVTCQTQFGNCVPTYHHRHKDEHCQAYSSMNSITLCICMSNMLLLPQ